MAMNDRELLANYLSEHQEVSDLLITGGDAFFMKASRLRYFLEPLLEPKLRHVSNIRFGTKVLSFWPHRFVTDADAEALLELISWLRSQGKSVSIMAHFNHWRELTPPILEEAVARLQAAGAVIRTQSPLLRGINDSPAVWSRLWRRQVELGMVPYYMFVLRDTGPKNFFEVPLLDAWKIYTEASLQLSGLAKTARGPVLSTGPGKIELTGITDVAGQSVFVFRFIQARDPRWVNQPFFGKFEVNVSWIDDVKPAFGAKEFFFSEDYRRMQQTITPTVF
jgi:L-lysine 2,3-aminomutase